MPRDHHITGGARPTNSMGRGKRVRAEPKDGDRQPLRQQKQQQKPKKQQKQKDQQKPPQKKQRTDQGQGKQRHGPVDAMSSHSRSPSPEPRSEVSVHSHSRSPSRSKVQTEGSRREATGKKKEHQERMFTFTIAGESSTRSVGDIALLLKRFVKYNVHPIATLKTSVAMCEGLSGETVEYFMKLIGVHLYKFILFPPLARLCCLLAACWLRHSTVLPVVWDSFAPAERYGTTPGLLRVVPIPQVEYSMRGLLLYAGNTKGATPSQYRTVWASPTCEKTPILHVLRHMGDARAPPTMSWVGPTPTTPAPPVVKPEGVVGVTDALAGGAFALFPCTGHNRCSVILSPCGERGPHGIFTWWVLPAGSCCSDGFCRPCTLPRLLT